MGSEPTMDTALLNLASTDMTASVLVDDGDGDCFVVVDVDASCRWRWAKA